MLVSWIKGGMHLVAVACFPHVRTEFQITFNPSNIFQLPNLYDAVAGHAASMVKGIVGYSQAHRITPWRWDAEISKLQVEDDAHGAHPPMGPAGLGGPGSQWPEITECHFAVRCFVMFCGSPGHGPLTSIDVRRTYRLPYTSVSKNSSMSTVKCESQNKQKQFCTVSCQIHCEEVQTKAEGIVCTVSCQIHCDEVQTKAEGIA